MHTLFRLFKFFTFVIVWSICAEGCNQSHPVATFLHTNDDAAPKGLHESIDAQAFATNAHVRHRILLMPFTEIAHHIGALRYECSDTMSFEPGGQSQTTKSLLRHDQHGNIYVSITSPAHSLETYRIQEDIFVRYDRGYLRQKTQRDMQVDLMINNVVTTAAQALGLFPNIVFDNQRTVHTDNRRITRYSISLHDNPTKQAHQTTALPKTAWQLPMLPVGPWRSEAHAIQAVGTIDIDATTGVLLRTEIMGVLELPKSDHNTTVPSQLHVNVLCSTYDINHTEAIRVPYYVPEFHRRVDITDKASPLGFFHDQLP